MTPSLDSFHVKICGITRIDDAEMAIEAGADMLGLNFVPSSPRCIDSQLARTIVAAVRGRALVVGVFADADEAVIRSVADDVPLDLIQLHGDESPEFVRALGHRAFKALSVASEEDLALASTYPGDLILLDARVAGLRGGTGVQIDPDLVAPIARERAVLLAGGLRPDNVADAVCRARPRGVDVASGVENAPGIKDAEKTRRFVEEARRAARELSGLLTDG